MAHLKRLRAPRFWPLSQRKGIKFVARPLPGAHKFEEAITLNVILIDLLKYTKTIKDSKRILNQGTIRVNNQIRKSPKFAVGILDTISLTSLNEHYRVLYNNDGKISLERIQKEETESRLAKIKNKTILKKQITQLNLHDGTNMRVEKDNYKTGDTILLQENKIKKSLKFEKGAIVYITGGKYKGRTGVVDHIEPSTAISEGKVTIKTNKEKITTKKDFAFVIEKPVSQ